jgi:cephalosporin-C deacetylase
MLIDMPLEQLLQYKGRNPRPKDMNAYWEESLAEMRAIEPHVELKPAGISAPKAECFDLYFTGIGGSRIHAKYVRPKGAVKGGKLPAVLQFHGYSGSSGNWLDKLAWAGQGFCIAALDCRGQGGLSEDKTPIRGTTFRGHIIRGIDEDSPKKLLFRSIYLDTAQLAGIVMNLPEVDPTRVGAFGGSQGGGLTLACAALEPRIKRAAPIYPFLSDYRRVWEMDLAVAAYEEIKTFFKQFDPRHEREHAIFERLGYIDVQHLAERIRAEVMFGIGLMDTVCPPSTQFAAYNKITSKKSFLLYPDFGHEELPGHADKIFEFMLGL